MAYRRRCPLDVNVLQGLLKFSQIAYITTSLVIVGRIRRCCNGACRNQKMSTLPLAVRPFAAVLSIVENEGERRDLLR